VIRIVGGGLAGSEAAWQAASRGVPVTLHEMRPVRPTAVHKTDRLAELVCSNSFRGDKLDNAVGLLKEEMRRLGSLVMRAAEASRVPAGAALAVDRDLFAETITGALASHPLVTIVREEILAIPDSTERDPVIIATGPLTSDALAADGFSAEVIDAMSLKPFDTATLVTSAAKTGAVVSCEEHSVIGGLGSAVAVALAENVPCPLELVGVKDVFGTSGEPEPLMVHFSLTADDIAAAARRAIARAS